MVRNDYNVTISNKETIMLSFDEFQKIKLTRDLFPQESCSRCGGSGKFSYCEKWGDMCFKCEGKGIALTQLGLKQYNYFRECLSIPVNQVKIGMKYHDDIYNKWRTVIDIKIIGTDRIELIHKFGSYGLFITDKLRVGFSMEERYQIYKKTLETIK
jgi:hypothetical protein